MQMYNITRRCYPEDRTSLRNVRVLLANQMAATATLPTAVHLHAFLSNNAQQFEL
jgi:hypothetical protein